MDNRPIGVFDSGLGGLTVVKELKRLLPNEDIIYFGDTGRVPYGTRSDDTVRRYAKEDEEFLLTHNVKMIVAACGTVSSVAYSTGKDLPVPFIEVVTPAGERAAALSRNKRIGVIGTPVTVKSRSHAKSILKSEPNAVVIANACPLFVPLVEEGWISPEDPIVTETAKRYLNPLIDGGVDTLIMGCTHYPALKPIFEKIMGSDVALVDPGTATAEKVKMLLAKNRLESDRKTGVCKYFVSDRADTFSKIAGILMGEDIAENVKQIDLFSAIGMLR